MLFFGARRAGRVSRRVGLRTGAATVAGAIVAAGASYAQTTTGAVPSSDQGQVVENVLVTAQKRGVAENSQTVPIALTALGSVQLDELHAQNLANLTTIARM
jgi:iron complex outermembrane receptor protein